MSEYHRAVVARWTRARDPRGHPYSPGRYACFAQPSPTESVATLLPMRAPQVPECLHEVRSRACGRAATLWVDGEQQEAQLRRMLLAGGARSLFDAVYLAHDGRRREVAPVPGVEIAPGREADLRELVVTKRQAFMATERAPDPARVEQELARRRIDHAGNARFLLARYRGEAVGFIGWLQDEGDCLINLLGVRVPYRRRGIGWQLVNALADYRARGGLSSLMVVPEPAVAPLYRGAGFTETVCWRRAFRLDTAP